MDADFPAAHSMDTVWFAVDREGHIALFQSGENGHVPRDAPQDGRVHWELLELRARVTGSDSSMDVPNHDTAFAGLGLFVYDYEEASDPIEPYVRTAVPDTPLHIDQLPPAMREVCKQFRLENLTFGERPLLQPLHYFDCDFWYGDDRVAYMCEDGKTVRPLTGKEDRFADFCREFRAEHPEKAWRLRFEGLAEDPDTGS